MVISEHMMSKCKGETVEVMMMRQRDNNIIIFFFQAEDGIRDISV